MTTSDKTDAISTAMLAVQREMANPKKTANNPFHKSQYAPLNEVMELSLSLLNRHGVVLTQAPGYEVAGDVVVYTLTARLTHAESGQYIETAAGVKADAEKGKSIAQVYGTIVTYLRRYTVEAMLGLVEEADTDGQTPTTGTARVEQTPDRCWIAGEWYGRAWAEMPADWMPTMLDRDDVPDDAKTYIRGMAR